MLALEVQMLHFQLQNTPLRLCVHRTENYIFVARTNGTSLDYCKLADEVIFLRALPVARSHLCLLAYQGPSRSL
jgi:hypothetical protein